MVIKDGIKLINEKCMEMRLFAKIGVRENALSAKMGSCENALLLQKELR